jgi:cold shock CspA family protein
MNGVVRSIVTGKAFGFIAGEDGKEYFFHKQDFNGFFTDLADDVTAGKKVKVTFSPTHTDKGPRASDVTRLDGGV